VFPIGRFLVALKESVEVFSEHPKFILPKLAVTLLYSIAIIFSVKFIVESFSSPGLSDLVSGLVVLAIELIALVVDTIVSLMFPLLVKQVREGKIPSFRLALKSVSSNFWRSVMPVALMFCLIGALTMAWAFVYLFILGGTMDPQDPAIIFFFAPLVLLVLVAAFLFYMIFPVSTLESRSVGASLGRAIRLSLSNWVDVAKALAVSFVLAGLSLILAIALNFISEEQSILFWAAFIIVRFLTAYIGTFTYILNPVFYFHFSGMPTSVQPKATGAAKAQRRK